MENSVNNNLPSEISVWTKVRNFLFHDIKLDLTPKQEKVFQEVHDFGHKKLQDKMFMTFYSMT